MRRSQLLSPTLGLWLDERFSSVHLVGPLVSIDRGRYCIVSAQAKRQMCKLLRWGGTQQQ